MVLVSADSALIREGKFSIWKFRQILDTYVDLFEQGKELKTAVQVWPRGRC